MNKIELIEFKVCTKCDENKSIEDFIWRNKTKGIKGSVCRNCRKEYNKIRTSRNKGVTRVVLLENRKEVKEKECHSCYETKFAEQFHKRKASADGLQKHCKECQKNHNIENRDRANELRRYNYENDPEVRKRIDTMCLKNKTERRKKDIQFKLRTNLRSKLYDELSSNNIIKSQSSLVLVGCSINELKQHLEFQFQESMTWENWGRGLDKWNIDHIKPCCSFDLTDIEQQKICFHYSNLRPLWAVDNLKKGYFDKMLKFNREKIEKKCK